MSTIMVDSCVVTDLADPSSEWFEWCASKLESLDLENHFVINSIIYTECSIAFSTIEEIENVISRLDFEIKLIPKEALFLAGKVFLKYRKNKGSKTNVLPDFFIGAHAAVEKYSLLTRDKGRFSSYFPSLGLIMP